MARSTRNSPAPSTREERIEELMQQLRPKVEEVVRREEKGTQLFVRRARRWFSVGANPTRQLGHSSR
jgi:ribosomal protein S16